MEITQLYTKCLAQGAYLIESNGEAAIIDPLRESQPYLDLLDEKKLSLKFIFETHFHADFVSGHVTLSKKTGAPIVYGPEAKPSFQSNIAYDGQTFQIGEVQLKVLHTPGHTLESSTYLLLDQHQQEIAIFTGDTLFLGDVGRPDLAQKAADMTQEDLAGMLYDSLRQKIMPLPDHIVVYPGHGAGSACGKNMMDETHDTLGNQKQVNYALRANMSKRQFIKEVTDGLLPPPGYFPLNVALNKNGYSDINEILIKSRKPLSVKEFEQIGRQEGAVILDVRNKEEFVKSHIPQSIFIGLDGSFAPWVGSVLVDIQTPLLLVAQENQIEEAIIRLARVGFDNVLGYLSGGINEWSKGRELARINLISPNEIEEDATILDVRKKTEYQLNHLEGSKNIPLSNLVQQQKQLHKTGKYQIHCATGYRSVIACSILQKFGFQNINNIEGGFEGILQNATHMFNKAN